MTKDRVREIMGQPYTSDAYGSLEVWKYIDRKPLSSTLAAAADTSSSTRLTDPPEVYPVAFENGRVIGWSEPFVTDRVQKYELRIR